MGIVVVLGLIGWFVSSFVAGAIWDSKGGSFGAGFALGLFLGVLGLFYVAGAIPQGSSSSPTPTKTCPRCAEDVKAAAVACRFCGHEFSEAEGAAALAEPPSSFEGHEVRDVTVHALGVDWGRTEDGRVVFRTRESPEWSLYERDRTPLVPPRGYRQEVTG